MKPPNTKHNLAKLDDGLAESPTVMVVDKRRRKTKKQKKQFWAKIGAYLNPVGLSSRPIRAMSVQYRYDK